MFYVLVAIINRTRVDAALNYTVVYIKQPFSFDGEISKAEMFAQKEGPIKLGVYSHVGSGSISETCKFQLVQEFYIERVPKNASTVSIKWDNITQM